MTSLLHIDSSPQPTSVSRELTREFSMSWQAAHPDGRVIYRDLALESSKPVDAAWIQAAYTPAEAREAAQTAALADSDRLLAELEEADEYVIGVAMHNFGIPSVLKLWIDQIARNGRTFGYGEDGIPRGLLTGKKATVVLASGGVYAAGTPFASMDFVEPYLRAVLGFIGIADLTFVHAYGTAQLRTGAITREAFLEPALSEVRRIAA